MKRVELTPAVVVVPHPVIGVVALVGEDGREAEPLLKSKEIRVRPWADRKTTHRSRVLTGRSGRRVHSVTNGTINGHNFTTLAETIVGHFSFGVAVRPIASSSRAVDGKKRSN
uniref:Uncharacterized protein n=1 Tax=Plectus sambesii TaxID=2011161 RepID=A0A914XT85_9BILA